MAHLAHEVVHVQNKNNVLTVWPIAAAVLQQELRTTKNVNRREVLKKLTQMHVLCQKLGFNLWVEEGKSMEEVFKYV